MSTDVYKKVGVSLAGSMHSAGQQRADAKYRGNFSAYIQDLIAADLAGVPISTAVSPTIITELVRTYAGYLAPQLEKLLAAHPIPQPLIVYQMLIELEMQLGGSVRSEPDRTHAAVNGGAR